MPIEIPCACPRGLDNCTALATIMSDCGKSFVDLVAEKDSCYVHDVRGFNYWNITEANKEFFANHAQIAHFPFQGGMNKLWRNQLLAMAVEQAVRLPYKPVSFRVV